MKKNKMLFFAKSDIYFDVYLLKLKRAENTIETYRNGLNVFMQFVEEEKGYDRMKLSFSDVDEDFMLDFRIWMTGSRKCTNETANHHFSIVLGYIKYCSKFDSSITALYLKLREIPPLKKEGKVPEEAMTDEQVALLLRQPLSYGKGLRDRTFMILLFETAARVSEVRLLSIGQLKDLDGKNPAVIFLGKGNKYRRLAIGGKVVQHVKAYIKAFHGPDASPDDYLFYTVIHGQKNPMSRDCVEKFLKKYENMARAKDPEFPEGIHSHLFRASKATQLSKDVSLPSVTRYLGHESPYTTMKYYIRPDQDAMREAIEGNAGKYSLSPEVVEELEAMKNQIRRRK